MTLGDAWGRDPDIAPDASPVSADYLRGKVLEFQQLLNSLDASYQASVSALDSGALTLEGQELVASGVAEYLEKRDWLRNTAAAINTASEAANALGLRMPVLATPRSLGALPLVGLATVIAAAAAAITWGLEYLRENNARLRRAQLIEAATPAQRERVLQAMMDSDTATAQAESGVVAQVAPVIKYVALAVAAWIAYRAWKG